MGALREQRGGSCSGGDAAARVCERAQRLCGTTARTSRGQLWYAAQRLMPVLAAAAASPGRWTVEPTPLVALSSLILAHGRPHRSCERLPGRPGSSAFGAGFELSRRPRTFRRVEKVVARPPPTEVSNLNTPSRWRRRGTGRG